ncbi:competence protein ComGD [Bacillus oleivorans]|uniref:Competence protein ComGD n=1 Tax=Bacillus oleivorans TaxID=1448271 RepID=A0A285CKA3_9BACI|nr:competence type IV pilus minor pilin ComGD [Bacillus oleivorans]SNX67939.1 competence protein ComGD [Bacillus oleivorans]
MAAHRKKWDAQGFTLTEILIVLSIFLICTSIFIFSVQPLDRHFKESQFITQLEKDLHLAKVYAMSHFQTVRIQFVPEENRYMILTGINNYLVQRKYNDEIKVINSTLRQFYYLPNGNVSKFGTFYILIGEKRYKFVIYVGKGRTEIEAI